MKVDLRLYTNESEVLEDIKVYDTKKRMCYGFAVGKL